MRKPFIAITQGDPDGIGPEIIVKSLERSYSKRNFSPIIVGDKIHFKLPKKLKDIPIIFPKQSRYHTSELSALDHALTLCLHKKVGAMVTAPVNKDKISSDEKIPFMGHTEYIGSKCSLFYKKKFHPTMFFVGKKEKIALATTHLPLSTVPQAITLATLKKTISNTHTGLHTLFQISKPRLALLGLNPHAGENGRIGDEEKDIFPHLFKWAEENKIHLSGPYSADTFFIKQWSHFDATIALYHDQGLIPFKMRSHPHAAGLTLGLPIIRTSVDHGVAYDMAKGGQACEKSLNTAIELAATLYQTQGEV